MKLYRKAIAAFLVTFTSALALAAADHGLAAPEWLGALAAATASAGAVFGVRNEPAAEPDLSGE